MILTYIYIYIYGNIESTKVSVVLFLGSLGGRSRLTGGLGGSLKTPGGFTEMHAIHGVMKMATKYL